MLQLQLIRAMSPSVFVLVFCGAILLKYFMAEVKKKKREEKLKIQEVCLPSECAFDDASRTKGKASRFIVTIIYWKRAKVYSFEPENEQLCTFIYHINNI